MKPKLIARYLPQYHRIPENDRWWGDGFTDWVTVKNAEALFADHRQPRRPLNDNYYNLLDRDTLKWQVTLAKEYGIDGFAFYHYWFSEGKRLLEKVEQNVLQWKDIDVHYCFCWANESWVRSWSKFVEGNAWADIYDKICTNENNDVLVEQKYGFEREWREHVEYLLPFFKDDRYIKYDGHPVFIIYRPERLYCLSDMLDIWNDVLCKNGLQSLFIIGESVEGEFVNNHFIDANLVRFAPFFKCIESRKKECGVSMYDYSEYWYQTLYNKSYDSIHNKTTYHCVTTDYDNTPRKGNKGTLLSGVTPEIFKENFAKLYDKSLKNGDEFIFINAWNEWGESSYLEPDTQWKYSFLEAVRDIVNGIYASEYMNDVGKLSKRGEEDHKYNNLLKKFKLLSYWMYMREDNKCIADFLLKNDIHCVAIYGYGELGQHLLRDLCNSRVKVVYIVDKNKSLEVRGLCVYNLEDDWPEVDVIIVTPIQGYDSIRSLIKNKMNVKTMSLEYILYEL